LLLGSRFATRAARALLGLEQRDLATAAKVDVSTVSRMEATGDKTARGYAANLEKVITALEERGIEFIPDGVRRVPRRG
jgi:transcriptional regulator with XRE-family HTH domain